MGYYTTFTLTVLNHPDIQYTDNPIVEDFKNSNKYEFWPDGDEDSSCVKWYTFDYDMENFSTQYPNHVFCLDGVGEEEEDVWRRYYKNGKCHRAIPVTEPFNELKLE